MNNGIRSRRAIRRNPPNRDLRRLVRPVEGFTGPRTDYCRLSIGNPGDIKALGGGISELRIDYGPGYRIYIAQRGPVLVLLLSGGDKSSQSADIARARTLAAQWDSD